MSDDDHPAIKRQSLYDGWSEHADVDPETFLINQAAKMALQDREQRVATLEHVDKLFDDPTTSLRQKAQLHRVRQTMARAHENMLRIGK
jgi:hypothetical protein